MNPFNVDPAFEAKVRSLDSSIANAAGFAANILVEEMKRGMLTTKDEKGRKEIASRFEDVLDKIQAVMKKKHNEVVLLIEHRARQEATPGDNSRGDGSPTGGQFPIQ